MEGLAKNTNQIMIQLLCIITVVASAGIITEEVVRRINCDFGNHREGCPIDGGWSSWGPWSQCVAECGQVGHRVRERKCNNPAPENNGIYCEGLPSDAQKCHLTNCTLDDYYDVIKGDEYRLFAFHILEEYQNITPALGHKCILADCHYTIIQNILKEEADTFWNAVLCVKYNVGCPISGKWNEWEDFTECSSLCGPGSFMKCRACNDPYPSNDQFNCQGENCTNASCLGNECIYDQGYAWGDWGNWTVCSATCGQGITKRMRECERIQFNRRGFWRTSSLLRLKNVRAEKVKKRSFIFRALNNYKQVWSKPTSTTLVPTTGQELLQITPHKDPQLEATVCVGPHVEYKPCYLQDCDVDGGWSEWSLWSECSSDCGIGAQYRARACSEPLPVGKGKHCTGENSQTKRCFIKPCLGKTHEVAVLGGNSILQYTKTGTDRRLLHVFIMYKPLKMAGTLVQLKNDHIIKTSSDEVKLYLEGGYLILYIQMTKCHAVILSNKPVKLGFWHTAMVMATNSKALMRLDDRESILSTAFSCTPVTPNYDLPITVGRNFKGEIVNIIINFVPRNLRKCKPEERAAGCVFSPFSNPNVAYDTGDFDETVVKLDELIQVPCPDRPDEWEIELVLKPDCIEGALILMKDHLMANYLVVSVEPNSVRLQIIEGDTITECYESIEVKVGQWIVLKIDNDPERGLGLVVDGGKRKSLHYSHLSKVPPVCKNYFLIGAIDQEIRNLSGRLSNYIKNLNSIAGSLAYLQVDGEMVDFTKLPGQRESGSHSFTSYSLSSPDTYDEVGLPAGTSLNLSCLKDFDQDLGDQILGIAKPTWLKFGGPLNFYPNNELPYPFYIYSTKYELKLTFPSYSTRESTEGFYGCWITNTRKKKTGRVKYMYGVSVKDASIEFRSAYTVVMDGLFYTVQLAFLSFFIWMLAEVILDARHGEGLIRGARKLRPTESELKFRDFHSKK